MGGSAWIWIALIFAFFVFPMMFFGAFRGGWRHHGGAGWMHHDSATETLRQRFASGQITKEQFDEGMKTLRGY